ncbi:MAG: isoprenylcysteine carboxylmethyltransferase family protein [Hyphomicrobiaceae bacterium]
MTQPQNTAAERANNFPWPPVLLVAAIALALALGRWAPLTWPGMDDGPAHFIGLAIGGVGLGLIVSAILTLRGHETTVMPDKMSSVLVTDGPYRFFRNPIYLGEVMAMFGLAELSKNIWFVIAGAAFALAVTVLQILPEERHLEARFGKDYLDYKQRARRWL